MLSTSGINRIQAPNLAALTQAQQGSQLLRLSPGQVLDILQKPATTAHFSLQELTDVLKITTEIQHNIELPGGSPQTHKTTALSRLIEKIINLFHGRGFRDNAQILKIVNTALVTIRKNFLDAKLSNLAHRIKNNQDIDYAKELEEVTYKELLDMEKETKEFYALYKQEKTNAFTGEVSVHINPDFEHYGTLLTRLRALRQERLLTIHQKHQLNGALTPAEKTAFVDFTQQEFNSIFLAKGDATWAIDELIKNDRFAIVFSRFIHQVLIDNSDLPNKRGNIEKAFAFSRKFLEKPAQILVEENPEEGVGGEAEEIPVAVSSVTLRATLSPNTQEEIELLQYFATKPDKIIFGNIDSQEYCLQLLNSTNEPRLLVLQIKHLMNQEEGLKFQEAYEQFFLESAFNNPKAALLYTLYNEHLSDMMEFDLETQLKMELLQLFQEATKATGKDFTDGFISVLSRCVTSFTEYQLTLRSMENFDEALVAIPQEDESSGEAKQKATSYTRALVQATTSLTNEEWLLVKILLEKETLNHDPYRRFFNEEMQRSNPTSERILTTQAFIIDVAGAAAANAITTGANTLQNMAGDAMASLWNFFSTNEEKPTS